ncbi:unnamed protein product [Protopolystoma xenopodis]|uniref:Uncharacterized protein n=1 Tax=Protopolystoma xenopodis TaxID=117903 RepID=A0A448XDA3_9PLAT|nr:unnamed protein product [Protopolystoma xenopodis]
MLRHDSPSGPHSPLVSTPNSSSPRPASSSTDLASRLLCPLYPTDGLASTLLATSALSTPFLTTSINSSVSSNSSRPSDIFLLPPSSVQLAPVSSACPGTGQPTTSSPAMFSVPQDCLWPANEAKTGWETTSSQPPVAVSSPAPASFASRPASLPADSESAPLSLRLLSQPQSAGALAPHADAPRPEFGQPTSGSSALAKSTASTCLGRESSNPAVSCRAVGVPLAVPPTRATAPPCDPKGASGSGAKWLACQAPILHCRGSTPAESVDKTDASWKLQFTGAWMRTTFGKARPCEIEWKRQLYSYNWPSPDLIIITRAEDFG